MYGTGGFPEIFYFMFSLRIIVVSGIVTVLYRYNIIFFRNKWASGINSRPQYRTGT